MYDTFVTAFLDDFLAGANSYELTSILIACIIDLFINLSVCF